MKINKSYFYIKLESQLEKKDQQFKEQEKTMSMLQQDIICKQHHLESLDRLLTESKRVKPSL